MTGANLPNQYSALCWRTVTHVQTWASYSALYRFKRLSMTGSMRHSMQQLLLALSQVSKGSKV